MSEKSMYYTRLVAPDGRTLEYEVDYTEIMVRSEGAADWENINEEEGMFCWIGETQEKLAELIAAAKVDGFVVDDSAAPHLADVLAAQYGTLPKAYEAFLREGLHIRYAEHALNQVPEFAADHLLWPAFASPEVPNRDFCDANGGREYVPISDDLRDSSARDGEPHALFLAVRRGDDQAPVVMLSNGSIVEAYPSLEAMVANLHLPSS